MRTPRLLGPVVRLGSKTKSWFSRLGNAEVAEALIATWCVEFLRVRRLGGFHVVEIVVISALMLGLKAIVAEAGRRRNSGKTYTLQARTAPMGRMDIRRRPDGPYPRHGRARFRDRRGFD